MNKVKGLTTWAEIDLEAVEHNLHQVEEHLHEDSNIIAVVKANAYGHGSVEVAKIAQQHERVKMLAVATIEEGIELREAGIELPILVLGTILESRIPEVVQYHLTPVVYTLATAQKIAEEAQQEDEVVEVHLGIDTGMGRIGILVDNQPVEKIKTIADLEHLKIEGIFTHFSAADEDAIYTKEQLSKFKQLLSDLEEKGIEIPVKHAANSAAIIDFPEAHFDLVRLGIALYGLPPAPSLADKIDLKAVLSWKAHVVHVKEVKPGANISYGCTYTADKETKVATLALGYYDGYDRRLSNQAEVIVKGQRANVIGRVCMDQIMIDVTGIEVAKGDTVTLIGSDGGAEIKAQELADKIGTINYEVVCRIGPRVERIF
ncbi:alanine racemase [Halanaerobacter jeridensis]|uniref:Alanine racemase n=1 Tax=Halanaerobacter jeridensis TaxID=706427 RepID=A0A939BMW0_9FIRM|nr:alanine racemase [Halanaerobacter jeridensis]MBM7557615.1 alanine racemase [Halanaerobacter jeridensis]